MAARNTPCQILKGSRIETQILKLLTQICRCRWGFFHVVNNDYTHWLMYAIGGSNAPTIISQGNRYIAPPNMAAKVVRRDDEDDDDDTDY